MHGFDGVSEAREGFWARELAALGVVTLVVESFSARGVGTSLANQSSVSTAQGVRDAYAALGYLAAQKEVDPARIGIMGMSRGGSVALRAVDHRKHASGPGFAAAIALYPGCVAQYRHPQPSAPIQVLIGGTTTTPCSSTAPTTWTASAPRAGAAELRVYPGARHGFDGDSPAVFIAHAQNLSDCLLYIEDDGSTTYAKTGERLDSPRHGPEVMRRDCIRPAPRSAPTPASRRRRSST